MTNNSESLPFLNSQERLEAYQLLLNGCNHIWSKNKLQSDKAGAVLTSLMALAKLDPYFLAHLTSYISKKASQKGVDMKDMMVFSAYASSLSVADGTPFSPGSKYMKPNLRTVGWAALHKLDPKLVERVTDVASLKWEIAGQFNKAKHFPPSLRSAIKKYLKYRENNLYIVKGIKRSGLGNVLANVYRKLSVAPSDEVAALLRWQQKDHKIEFAKQLIDFKGLTDLEIAEKIRKEKLPYLGVLGGLTEVGKKVSPVIAVALLEQATGNQAVIMRATFEDAGILKDKEVKALYEEKIKSAKSALDRVDAISANASEEIKEMMKNARSEKNKASTAGIGKIYLHLDFSGSMSAVQQYASEKGSIFAECVNDPANNFRWGCFGGMGVELRLPDAFERDAFAARLFAQTGLGSTDCFALYPNARAFGADVDVFVSDQAHTDGNLTDKIRQYHEKNPNIAKPKACVIINFGSPGQKGSLANAYETNGIPVSLIQPETLSESALVVEAVKTSLLGPVAIVDEIMATELLKLPEYYYTL